MTTLTHSLPIPAFFHATKVREVWRVPYAERATQAKEWAKTHSIPPASQDKKRVGLLLIDVQNTFCLPDFELYVAGRSGSGAIDDNVRLCEFIYRNLGVFTNIVATMDTHVAMQIFHPFFWVNEKGKHPPANTMFSVQDVENGVWKVNPAVAYNLPGWDYENLQQYALHYARHLSNIDKYPLMIWAYHGKLGGIGHALVSAVEEAVFFHSMARETQTQYEQKGSNPLTENYSVLRPEVLEDHKGNKIAVANSDLINQLLSYDALIIAGQAKSHCVAWTISNLLNEIEARDAKLAEKIYLLEDCTSAVVVHSVDFTEQADQAFERFQQAGMKLIKSTDLI